MFYLVISILENQTIKKNSFHFILYTIMNPNMLKKKDIKLDPQSMCWLQLERDMSWLKEWWPMQ